MQQELTAAQKESKQSFQVVSELRISNAGLEHQVSSLRREIDDTKQEMKRAGSAMEANANFGDGGDHSRGGSDDHQGHEKVSLSEAQEEIRRIQSHYENEIVLAKKERVELVSKV